ncbi:MAG: aminoacetone oxidase family FAD-binding enzyme [Clostridia bacterium]|nr:aminoacetone oxidase family FAD-binding enzyme [Clostridia bacterium]
MEKISIAIIGGGAAGLFAAASLYKIAETGSVVVFERGERVGRKLSATGNGQGNVSNTDVRETRYFSVQKSETGQKTLQRALERYGVKQMTEFFETLGVMLQADARGRVYPCSKQASSLTDALRFFIEKRGVRTKLGAFVKSIEKRGDVFLIACDTADGETRYLAENVVLCAGGKAAKNFGTDGAGYSLIKKLGHTLTATYPSLVQLKCDTKYIKTLKGIRAADARVTASVDGTPVKELVGDVIFTDYGVSGDAIFRISAFLTAYTDKKLTVSIDFLPNVDEERLLAFVTAKKRELAPKEGELLCGILNNQIARAVEKRYAGAPIKELVKAVKNFPIDVTGNLGYDYAQVTKGGVPLEETDENFQSKKAAGLYLAGEILDVDGECGGFNLHFAFASAKTVAAEIEKKYNTRGQV